MKEGRAEKSGLFFTENAARLDQKLGALLIFSLRIAALFQLDNLRL